MAEAVDVTLEVVSLASPAPTADLEARYVEAYPSSLRLAFLLTGDRQSAEDLVQEAFVRIFSRPRRLQDPAAFPSYVRRTITNLAFSRGRSAARERLRTERAANAAVGSAGSDATQLELDLSNRELLAALDVLPDRQRTAVVLRFWLDLGEREMAQLLRCRPGTVKSLLSRALATLRNELEP
jgi:RNA polymerase sigma-70 factor (sigma-E family)